MLKGGVIGMAKEFFLKRLEEGYNLVLMGWELRALAPYFDGKKIVFNDFKELNSLESKTIISNELYVVVVCPATVYIHDIERDEEWKYRLHNPWGGFGQYRVYTVDGDCYVGNPQDGWVLEKEAV